MNSSITRFVIALTTFVCLPLVIYSVGGGQAFAQDEFPAAADFDESQLPADFPRQLIPASYDTGSYYQIGPVEGATFESRAPVAETIAYYVDLLGEPTLNVEGDGGDRSAQWHEIGPWLLGIVGGLDESIIGFTRNPNQASP